MRSSCWLSVLVALPAHSSHNGPLTYTSECPLAPGSLVRVPLGSRDVPGIVWGPLAAPPDHIDPSTLRPVTAHLDSVPALSPAWLRLVDFAASYYQRSPGELALSVLPPSLRDLTPVQMGRRLRRALPPSGAAGSDAPPSEPARTLSPGQAAALTAIRDGPGPFLVHGATGSGKTEVYLQAATDLLRTDPRAQVLFLVPEINLTPQFQERLVRRFAPEFGPQAVVTQHSAMTPARRLASWLAAHTGSARVVLGTRLAVFASMPWLRLVVVDEEHDPSYKQQEGARYSARDLAVYRGKLEGATVILGSATPSLESWYLSRPASEGGRYLRLSMPERIGAGALPVVRRVDMNRQSRHALLSAPLIEALRERITRQEQSLLLLNRRGYAPVLHCTDCGWKSECPHCSAYRVFHKHDRTLRCHHCGFTQPVPRACPACGNPDIRPLGRGTERLEEMLAETLSTTLRPDGTPVRIARIDADTTRHTGALESQLAAVHAGEVDILVGTQMVAKGHDFRRMTLVAAINPDGALFSSDFRAPERLFALLMQAGGRAGRDAQQAGRSEMWVQTFHPSHPVFEALKRHDYPAFAASQLAQRAQAGLPPFLFQALLRADAATQEQAQEFLNDASSLAEEHLAALLGAITRYPAVPLLMQRVANVERAQLLVESPSRPALQRFVAAWQPLLQSLRAQPRHRRIQRWAVDIDPLAI